MSKDEQMLQAAIFGVALCAIATRERVINYGTSEIDNGAVMEARIISRAVVEEFNRIQGD